LGFRTVPGPPVLGVAGWIEAVAGTALTTRGHPGSRPSSKSSLLRPSLQQAAGTPVPASCVPWTGHTVTGSYLFIYLFWWDWGLNSGPPVHLALVILEMGSHELFAWGWPQNAILPVSGSRDDRREPLAPGFPSLVLHVMVTPGDFVPGATTEDSASVNRCGYYHQPNYRW
jgi:hypothetical protein